MSYRPIVATLVKDLVDNPDQVNIEEEYEDGTRTFFVHVAQEDVGKVIGKSGRVISAVRTVVSALAAREQERAFVKVPTE
ncbi:MAG: KH domain-containing protein [Armatimonadetes bacterium]|nr:KH domain-containing protein [Armatimonadota bacterium]